jgi:hypothetical protein
MPDENSNNQKKPGLPPAVVLVVAAVIIFGLMFGFLFFENINADWLRPNT